MLSCHFLLLSLDQETLVRVAVWCIGEYGEMLVSNAGMLDVEDSITVSFPQISFNCHLHFSGLLCEVDLPGMLKQSALAVDVFSRSYFHLS